MSNPVFLRSASGTLTLTRDQEGAGDWCQVHLVSAGVERPLGAESHKILSARLLQFLAALSSESTEPKWIFSLAERHCSAYAAHIDGVLVLQLQDAAAEPIGSIKLTCAERNTWIAALAAWEPLQSTSARQ